MVAAGTWAQARGEDYPLLILPSDHFVADQGAFLRAVLDGAQTAARGYRVCFGVVADWASVDQCYLEVAPRLDAAYSGHKVASVCPNPDPAEARQLIDAQRFVWHAGMTCLMPAMAKELREEPLCVISLLSAWADLKTWPGIWKALSLIET